MGRKISDVACAHDEDVNIIISISLLASIVFVDRLLMI
jgi:hypothetical protein